MSIIKFVQNLLTNRRTHIKFDDYKSDPILLENGIGQGDPLSYTSYITLTSLTYQLIPKQRMLSGMWMT